MTRVAFIIITIVSGHDVECFVALEKRHPRSQGQSARSMAVQAQAAAELSIRSR